MYFVGNYIKKIKYLDEISFIRPILIVLLVLYHSFAPWCGSWDAFVGFENNSFYWWIAKTSYSFMLPMFVFISGYIWAYQREVCLRKDGFLQLVKKKIKRLYFPSLLFSCIYCLIFHNAEKVELDIKHMVGIIVTILSGMGHMWFLPMLLMTFMISWLLLEIRNEKVLWGIVLILFFMSVFWIPFGVSRSFYYIIYFILGYKVFNFAEKIRESVNKNCIYILWGVFVCVFVGLTIINESLENNIYVNNLFFIKKTCSNILSIIWAILGIGALYSTAIYISKNNTLPEFLITVGDCCFGVYLFQQFFLKFLYYNSSLSNYIGINLLPWVCFIIVLIVSLVLSYLVRLTVVGRQLI